MNSRSSFSGGSGSYPNNSPSIRQEIQRFESVHPCIYALYDLIEVVTDPMIQHQIREHIVCIEGMLARNVHGFLIESLMFSGWVFPLHLRLSMLVLSSSTHHQSPNYYSDIIKPLNIIIDSIFIQIH